jgi:hypothetical protein
MDGWIISLSPLFLLLQEMMMMHSFITAPQRHFFLFLWARSRVFSPRVCAPGFFFRVGCGCGAHPLEHSRNCCERCEEIYTSARTDFDGTRCMVIVIRCERGETISASHVCVLLSV